MPPSPTRGATGVPSAGGSSSATATGRRSTADAPERRLEGILLLTAGLGRRAEPLSILRPKSLLPWEDTTVLGRLAAACARVGPCRIAVNASRCPDLVVEEVERCTGRECTLMFEERPLGVCGTLARLLEISAGGDWLVCNTDAVTDLDFGALTGGHLERRPDWTAVLGGMPPSGGYRPVGVSPGGAFPSSSGRPRHYWGYSVLGRRVLEAASGHRTEGLFSGLAASCASAGMRLEAHDAAGEWLDTGEAETYRVNLLSRPSVVREGAVIEDGASLEGRWYVGRGCRVASGAVLRDSVMLDGSALLGGVLERSVLPWLERRGAG